MSTVAEIKEAIGKLSPEDYCELMAELFPHADDEWDRQMKADAQAGRLDFIDRGIKKSCIEGTATPLGNRSGSEPVKFPSTGTSNFWRL